MSLLNKAIRTIFIIFWAHDYFSTKKFRERFLCRVFVGWAIVLIIFFNGELNFEFIVAKGRDFVANVFASLFDECPGEFGLVLVFIV